MNIIRRKDTKLDGTNPVLLTGYGGYGISIQPYFIPRRRVWLDMGGVMVIANLRGGGEYGEEWHRAGSLERKQNTFDDFIAGAEYLVGQRYTSPARLAIYGHSNGGMLIGAVMTQRPDLFAVALPNAGHHDMLRYHRFTVGAGWIPEYGSPDDPAAFRWLRAYSPLHNVRAGTCYPATMLLTADHDDRERDQHDDVDGRDDAHDRDDEQDQHAPRVRARTLLLGEEVHGLMRGRRPEIGDPGSTPISDLRPPISSST